MAGRILKDDIEALRQQANIVTIVEDYTRLKQAGRSFKGLCPFHTEKSPSFTVTPEGNFFHCFGCGASGDLYEFLMRVEGLEFPEAVESLARRVGFTLRYEQLTARERQSIGERSRLVEVTRAARDEYTRMLYDDVGEPARDYLRSRGFGRDDVERFGLGYAPLTPSTLSDALTAGGMEADDLIKVGLAIRTDRGRLRDRFRGRLMFPVEDVGGEVIGFGGRVLPALDYGNFDPPKYLNSPETPLYKKANVLYGLTQARADIVRKGQVLVCEGYTDVLALHQAGVTTAVATCGTAVGDEHLRLMSRYAQRTVVAFDADDAGVKAAERAWEAARRMESQDGGGAMELRVLVLDAGSDPADLVGDRGPDAVLAAVDDAVPIVPFIIDRRLATADLTTESGRTAALRETLEIVGLEPDEDLRREWARTEVADRVGVSYDFVVRTAARMGIEIDAHEGVAIGSPQRVERRQVRDGNVTSSRSGSGPARRTDQDATQRLDRATAQRERAVLRVALQRPDLLPDEWFELTENDFAHPRARLLFSTIQAAGGAGVDLEAIVDAAADDEVRSLVRAVALEDDPALDVNDADEADVPGQVAAERVRRLLAERLSARALILRDELSRLHHLHDAERMRELQQQLIELERRRRTLAPEAG
ncbi:MAG: DNA primase [Nitriliruptoraceae bacterium]